MVLVVAVFKDGGNEMKDISGVFLEIILGMTKEM